MNLPNKLTLSRVIMVPFYVAFILLVPRFLYFSQPDRFIGWQNCQKIQSDHQFWQVYGSTR